MEPHRLRKWKPRLGAQQSPIYTCARPGRSRDNFSAVPDNIVDRWVEHLPSDSNVIISLLGRKNGPAGESEFSFYSFCGGLDSPSERSARPTFLEWLTVRHPSRGFFVEEFPTYDGIVIPSINLEAIEAAVWALLGQGQSPVIVDSGGLQRTGQVCKYMELTEYFI